MNRHLEPRPGVLTVPPETITVGGFGSASRPADLLRARLTATTARPTLAEADTATEAALQRVRSALTGAGVATEDVIGLGRNAGPDYDDDNRHTGYRAEHPVSIDLHDLDTADHLLGTAVAAGGNDVRLDEVAYRLADDTALRVQAGEAAWTDALQRATHLAGLAGRALGPVRHLREGGIPDLPEHRQQAAMRDCGESGATTPHGRVSMSVVVFAVWALA